MKKEENGEISRESFESLLCRKFLEICKSVRYVSSRKFLYEVSRKSSQVCHPFFLSFFLSFFLEKESRFFSSGNNSPPP